MKIECPGCKKHHSIIGEPVCGECGEALSDGKAVFIKKPIMQTVSAIVIPAGVVWGLHSLTDDPARYPLAYEYEIVEQCSSSTGGSVYWETARRRKELCLCSVANISSRLSFGEFQKNPSTLKTAVKNGIEECRAEAN